MFLFYQQSVQHRQVCKIQKVVQFSRPYSTYIFIDECVRARYMVQARKQVHYYTTCKSQNTPVRVLLCLQLPNFMLYDDYITSNIRIMIFCSHQTEKCKNILLPFSVQCHTCILSLALTLFFTCHTDNFEHKKSLRYAIQVIILLQIFTYSIVKLLSTREMQQTKKLCICLRET